MVTGASFFPFVAIGYRRNPFGVLTDAEWAEVAVLPPAVRAAWDTGEHVQLLGPMGCGKTTTLRALQQVAQLAGQQVVYEYLPIGQHRFRTRPFPTTTFCLDEGQRLWWGERWRLRRYGRTTRLLIGSHEDLRPWFVRDGQPIHSLQLTETITLAHWQSWLARRLAYFALPQRERPFLTDTGINWLYQQFGYNLREAEYLLYDVWQALAQSPTQPHPLPADGIGWGGGGTG